MVVFNLDLSSNFDDDLYLPRFKGAGNCAPFILCHLSPPGDTLDPWGTYDVPEKHEGRIYDTAVILRSTVDKSGWHSRLAVKNQTLFHPWRGAAWEASARHAKEVTLAIADPRNGICHGHSTMIAIS